MNAATRSINVGDVIQYRGGFGLDAPSQAKVTSLEVTQFPREKYGEKVAQVSYGIVEQNRCLFSLDNNHWCYSDQVVLPGGEQ